MFLRAQECLYGKESGKVARVKLMVRVATKKTTTVVTARSMCKLRPLLCGRPSRFMTSASDVNFVDEGQLSL